MKNHRFAVLDDDPTGIQTVHGCLLITDTGPETVAAALGDAVPFFYVLTNTRAYDSTEADAIIENAVRDILDEASERELEISFISRSDSTLRSHFPVEIDAIERVMSELGTPAPDAIFLIPAFFEGGRLTRDDTHFMQTDSGLIPTSESEFAKDSVFGYSTSHLPGYIEEKTGISAARVETISLEEIRGNGAALTGRLMGLSNRRFVGVNAETYDDLAAFCRSLNEALTRGKRFLFQTAASFVKAVTDTPNRPLLTRDDFHPAVPDSDSTTDPAVEMDGERPAGNGIILVGSHVAKTTRQVERLLEEPGVRGVEIEVTAVLEGGESYLRDTIDRIEKARADGLTPAAYTSRSELIFPDRHARIQAGKTISSFIVSLAAAAMESPAGPPAFMIAKGGITSHDILTHGLGVSRTRVAGQVLPGIPAVRIELSRDVAADPGSGIAGADSPGAVMPYVIFPGNVGDDDALATVFRNLQHV